MLLKSPDGTTAPASTRFLGDRVRLGDLQVQNGLITVTYYIHGKSQPMAAEPAVKVIKQLKVSGGLLVDPQQQLGRLPEQAVTALKQSDLKALAGMVHPVKGVRLSPYGHVSETDRVFSAEALSTAATGSPVLAWGSYDGSGEPIELTIAGFLARFINVRDYLNPEQVGYNQVIGRGNTLLNLHLVYPDGIFTEFYFAGTEQYGGMDWRSLRLVFELHESTWYLVGIINDEWTI